MFFPEVIKKLEDKKQWRIALFTLCVALGIAGLISGHLQRAASDTEQENLRAELQRIRKNTETPPSVVVNVPPSAPPQIIMPRNAPPEHSTASFIWVPKMPQLINEGQPNGLIAVGVPLHVNLYLTNQGTEPVQNFYRVFGIRLVAIGDNPDDTDRQVNRDFRKKALRDYEETSKTSKGHTVNLHQVIWNTLSTPPLEQQHVDGLMNGKTRLYAYEWARWKDGKHDLSECFWLQPPPTPLIESPIWHNCAE